MEFYVGCRGTGCALVVWQLSALGDEEGWGGRLKICNEGLPGLCTAVLEYE